MSNDKRQQTGQSMWGGRFSESTDDFVARLNASVGFDQRLYNQDIRGSIAHAKMLKAQGIITDEECAAICNGLSEIEEEIKSGQFEWSNGLEDVHMNIEHALTQRIGDAGGKLHTARSRNDQVATDLRLWVRDECDGIAAQLLALMNALVALAEKHTDTVLPGYTHLQRAQPIVFGHHLLAYAEMFYRDRSRLLDCRSRTNESPLGSAALAGTPFEIDRQMTATSLGFTHPMRNSLDAVASRDFVIELAGVLSIMMSHLSRLSEELVNWSSQEFNFIELSDAFSTGSSIMPQKKNPDIPELIRGKSGRVFGHLQALLTLVKGLPLAYNKDLQEDKEAIFDAVDTSRDCLTAMTRLLPDCTVNVSVMRNACDRGFVTATDVADYLASRGLPFREAHHVVGQLVGWCIQTQRTLNTLTLTEFKQFHAIFEADICEVVQVESSVSARRSFGGTAPSRVRSAITEFRQRLADLT
ncbi:MAG: argininosuccinate lyase [Bradymonadia bacterium]